MHKRLHPELCAFGLFDADLDATTLLGDHGEDEAGEVDDALYGEELDEGDRRELEREIDALGWLAKLFRIDVAKLKALSPDRQMAFLESLDAVGSDESAASLAKARTLVERFGVAKSSDPGPTPFKAQTKKDKNRRKRERNQMKKKQGK
jgi:hypothetical protein